MLARKLLTHHRETSAGCARMGEQWALATSPAGASRPPGQGPPPASLGRDTGCLPTKMTTLELEVDQELRLRGAPHGLASAAHQWLCAPPPPYTGPLDTWTFIVILRLSGHRELTLTMRVISNSAFIFNTRLCDQDDVICCTPSYRLCVCLDFVICF